ncbi:MAG: class A beta-lactamase [Caulobacter sp.]|nr:class A beta-lactamase [Caulobacter sp.]
MTRPLLAFVAAFALAACQPAGTTTVATTPPLDAALLDREIGDIAAGAQPAMIEVAVQNLDGGEMWAWNGDRAFPMQSVFKAPLGAAVLAEVDAGALSLDEVLTIREQDLSPPYSPVADAWPAVSTYTVRDLLARAVGGSDNTAADVLMKRIGGPGVVTARLQTWGLKELRIDRYERELQPEIYGMASFRLEWKGWPAFKAARDSIPEDARRAATARYLADPRDTVTGSGALNFLRKLAVGELLSPRSTALLLKIMTDSPTGPNRLKAGLPAGATLAHKTGTSGTDLGLTPVVNDIGIVTLKDGRRYAVAVFMTASPHEEAARDKVFADVMRVVVRAAG